MRRLGGLTKAALAGFLIILLGSFPLFSQSALSESGVGDGDDFLIELEAYVKYGGSIDVIDGMTGKEYHGGSQVVKAIYNNFPKIMGGLHNRLLELEARHMAFQMTQGVRHGKQLSELAKTFGIKGFYLDKENWLKKEKTILSRLNDKPFFKIKELVVWEREELSGIAIRDNERGKNLKFNTDTLKWERRVLTEWEVNIRSRNSFKRANKYQGLNLDTNEGFHISDVLPGNVYTGSFEEVKVSYPIIVSRSEDEQEQIDRLQRLIVKNLSYLYDPFSWAGRRNTRFRTAFVSRLKVHMEQRGSRISDREWFDPLIANFLNDIVTLKIYGLKEVYGLYVTQRFENSRFLMGEAMDPLNWNEGEDRASSGKRKNVKVKLDFKNPDGARFVLLDMYLRYGDAFLENIRPKITSITRKTESLALVRASIEEVSGVAADTYINAALRAQETGILSYHKNQSK